MAKHVNVKLDMGVLAVLPKRTRSAVGREVRKATLDLLSEAVRRAPVEEGILRGSGSAHFDGKRIATGEQFDRQAQQEEGENAPVGGGHGTEKTTGVVGFNAVYAEYQHEETGLNHPKGGEAKYLERPAVENEELYHKRIREATRRALRGRP